MLAKLLMSLVFDQQIGLSSIGQAFDSYLQVFQNMAMKTVAGGSPSGGHVNNLPKLRLKRTRTCSSDSGCDVFCESPDLSSTIMEDAVQTWEIRLDGVVKQEVERAWEVTNWAKEALRLASEGTATLKQNTDLDLL